MPLAEVGKAISDRRKRLKLGQAAVVEALNNGGVDISITTYRRVERGKTSKPFADPQFVGKLATILKLNPEDLLAQLGHIQTTTVHIDTRSEGYRL